MVHKLTGQIKEALPKETLPNTINNNTKRTNLAKIFHVSYLEIGPLCNILSKCFNVMLFWQTTRHVLLIHHETMLVGNSERVPDWVCKLEGVHGGMTEQTGVHRWLNSWIEELAQKLEKLGKRNWASALSDLA